MKTDDQSGALEYQVELADDGSYIRITHLVDITTEAIEKSLGETSRLSKETGVLRHLVDVTRVRSAQSATDMYMLMYKKISVSSLFRNFKIAVVTHPDDNSHDFIETLLYNIGGNGKIFKNEDQALAWLKE